MSRLRATLLTAVVGVVGLVLLAGTPQEVRAQQAAKEVTATGKLVHFSEVHGVVSHEPKTCGGLPCPEHGLVDEASGVRYGLLSEEELGGYLGQRVTISGTIEVEAAEGGPALVDVACVERTDVASGVEAACVPGGDLLRGGEGNDHLKGGRGDDLLVAGAGADEVYGGPGDDGLYAAYDLTADVAPNAPASRDLLEGGEGADFVDAADAPGAADKVHCGPGVDVVEADPEDIVADDCEEVHHR